MANTTKKTAILGDVQKALDTATSGRRDAQHDARLALASTARDAKGAGFRELGSAIEDASSADDHRFTDAICQVLECPDCGATLCQSCGECHCSDSD